MKGLFIRSKCILNETLTAFFEKCSKEWCKLDRCINIVKHLFVSFNLTLKVIIELITHISDMDVSNKSDFEDSFVE